MGMFDTVYTELECPFCSRPYRYTPMAWEEAECEVKKHKQWALETRQKHLRGEEYPFSLQASWAKQDGFDDVDAWIAQLDAPEHIEAYRTRRHLGLAEIQTKEFESVLEAFYIGDEVPKYSGHYFIPEDFICAGCSTKDEIVFVDVWLEIDERRLKAVLVRDPETGEPGRVRIKRTSLEPLTPTTYPPLFFNRAGIQAQAKFDNETGMYRGEVTHISEQFTFAGRDEEELRLFFDLFVDGYLYLLGKTPLGEESLHKHLHSYPFYGQLDRGC
jgi:hypothetical protein